MSELPRIISTDDHVVEPPDLWTSRLPAKYQDKAPHVERDRAKFGMSGGVFSYNKGAPDGEWCDFWIYDDLIYPFPRLSAAIGFPDLDNTPVTFDEIRPGCWKRPERLQDMDDNHVDASICFPNVLPRFAGQAFDERADKDLALLCVQAYNDWMIDEWCAGEGHGRLIPLTIVPLWDADARRRRDPALRGEGQLRGHVPGEPVPARPAVDPQQGRLLGPVLRRGARRPTPRCACTSGRRRRCRRTSPDSPFIVSSTLTFQNAMGSLCDYIFSGTLEKLPHAEARVLRGPGRVDAVRARARRQAVGRAHQQRQLRHVAPPPAEQLHGRAACYGCIFDDEIGLREPHVIGMEQITFETDYPHADSTFPHSKETAQLICDKAGLDDRERYLFLRGNAIKAFGLERFGITK